MNRLVIASLGLLLLAAPARPIWFVCDALDALEYADQAARLDQLPTSNDPWFEAQVQIMRKHLIACGVAEAIEIAKSFPGTTFTGPPPTSVRDAVIWILQQLGGSKQPGSVLFGDLTRTAYEGFGGSATVLEMSVESIGNNGAISSGSIATGDVLLVRFLDLPLEDYLTPTTGTPESFGFLRVMSTDPVQDSFAGELIGLAHDYAPNEPFAFVKEIEISGDGFGMDIRGFAQPFSNVVVEASDGCGGVEQIPTNWIADPWSADPFLQGQGAFEIRCPLPAGPAAREIRIRVDGASVGSNPLVFDLSFATSWTQPLDRCRDTMCVDRSDIDNDGIGDQCDNCPATWNPRQSDADGNGSGDLCDVSSTPAGIAALALSAQPNPSSGITQFSFRLAQDGPAQLEIFDLRGRRLRTLRRLAMAGGTQFLQWDGRGDGGDRLSSGVYLARLRTELAESTVKLTIQ